MTTTSGSPVVSVQLRDRHSKVVAVAFLDFEDRALAEHRWCLNTMGYAQRYGRVEGRRTVFLMHREVLGLVHGDGTQCDHINRDKLDNRRSNLRPATNAQNGQNVPSHGKTSSHRGVSWNTKHGNWRAQASVDGRNHHLGCFDREEDAAEAARAFRAEHMPFAVEVVA